MKTGFYIFSSFDISEIIYYTNGFVFFEKNVINGSDFQFDLDKRGVSHYETNNFNIVVIDDLYSYNPHIDFLYLSVKNDSIIVKTMYEKLLNNDLIYA